MTDWSLEVGTGLFQQETAGRGDRRSRSCDPEVAETKAVRGPRGKQGGAVGRVLAHTRLCPIFAEARKKK